MASALLRKCELATELTHFNHSFTISTACITHFSSCNDHVRLNKQNKTMDFILFKILLFGTISYTKLRKV